MSEGKARTPMVSERNSVVWVGRKGRPDSARRFVREHALAYPKLGVSASRRYSGLILGAFFIIMLFSASAFGYSDFTTALCNAAMAVLAVFAADSIFTGISIVRFTRKQLEKGGETIDPWNARMIKTCKIAMVYIKPALTVIFTAVVFLAYYNDTVRVIGFRGFPLFYWALMLLAVVVNVYPAEKACPYIFFGAESGMVFGGALFPYEALRGIKFGSSGGEFELFHEGKLVAKGVMLADDRYHLQDMHSELK